MGLMTTDQAVVARKSSIPLTFPVAFFQRHALSPRASRVWEAVTTIGTLGLAAGTSVLAQDGSSLRMPVVSSELLHERTHQVSDFGQIHAHVGFVWSVRIYLS